jgi:hypothetical protein
VKRKIIVKEIQNKCMVCNYFGIRELERKLQITPFDSLHSAVVHPILGQPSCKIFHLRDVVQFEFGLLSDKILHLVQL